MSLVRHPPSPLELDHPLPSPLSQTSHCPSPSPSPSLASIASFHPFPSPPPTNTQPQEYIISIASSSKRPTLSRTPSQKSLPPCRTDKKFKCSYEGCDKAYTKPSRLAEHEITHTGERPYACSQCHKSFLRDSHLRDHMRTHLSTDQKRFTCPRPGCGKKFWTAQHLKKHEDYHDRSETYPCEQCEQTFTKTHLLRDHITLAHMPKGTKPWPCDHAGCGASFALKSHLTRHKKTHDANRYTCSHPSHGTDFPSFPVWSALQSHMHQAHPPTCPHEECNGRSFKNAQRLKDHLKVHAERDVDAAARTEALAAGTETIEAMPQILADGLGRRTKRRRSEVSDGGKSPKLPRLTNGEAGKDFACEQEGCEKRFKTKYALNTHHNAVHLKIRNHTCPIEGCDKAYPHLVTLNKHIASHSRPSTPAGGHKVNGVDRNENSAQSERPQRSALTGIDKADMRRFGCPYWAYEEYHLDPLLRDTVAPATPAPGYRPESVSRGSMANLLPNGTTVKREPDLDVESIPRTNGDGFGDQEGREEPDDRGNRRMIRFWRVYDVRRHLRTEHGLEMEDMEVRQLLLTSGQTGERD